METIESNGLKTFNGVPINNDHTETIYETQIRRGRITCKQAKESILNNLKTYTGLLMQSLEKDDMFGITIHTNSVTNCSKNLNSLVHFVLIYHLSLDK